MFLHYIHQVGCTKIEFFFDKDIEDNVSAFNLRRFVEMNINVLSYHYVVSYMVYINFFLNQTVYLTSQTPYRLVYILIDSPCSFLIIATIYFHMLSNSGRYLIHNSKSIISFKSNILTLENIRQWT